MRVLSWCYQGVIGLLWWFYRDVVRVLLGCYRRVMELLWEYYKGFIGCY